MVARNHARGSLAPATPSPQFTGCNPLVQSNPCDTLSAVREVLALVQDWAGRRSVYENPQAESGLAWVMIVVDDAVSTAGKQIQGERS